MSTATLTGFTGPAFEVESLVLTGVENINIAPAPTSVLSIRHSQGIFELDLNDVDTITVSASSGDINITASN